MYGVILTEGDVSSASMMQVLSLCLLSFLLLVLHGRGSGMRNGRNKLGWISIVLCASRDDGTLLRAGRKVMYRPRA